MNKSYHNTKQDESVQAFIIALINRTITQNKMKVYTH
jgi:hypothetical protein